MYQWRKFEFFEEKLGGEKCNIPDEISGKIECAFSGRGKLVIGCDDGSVSLLDRGLNFNFGFQAHSSSILFLQMLKQRNFLLTIGEDEQISPQQAGMCLKVFDLDKMQPEGSSTTTPDCIGILRIFTNQFPHAKIFAPLPIGFAVFLVHLATIPITGTGINSARSLGAAIIFNKDKGWDDHWIFWVGPFIGAALAALYHVVVIRAIPFKSSDEINTKIKGRDCVIVILR